MSADTPRKQPRKVVHLTAHMFEGDYDARDVGDGPVVDDVIVFGTELEALRHIVGKPGWEYVALTPGQSFAAAFKAARG